MIAKVFKDGAKRKEKVFFSNKEPDKSTELVIFKIKTYQNPERASRCDPSDELQQVPAQNLRNATSPMVQPSNKEMD